MSIMSAIFTTKGKGVYPKGTQKKGTLEGVPFYVSRQLCRQMA